MNFDKIKAKKRKYELIYIVLSVIWVFALIIGIVLGVGLAMLLEDGEALELVLLPPALVSGVMLHVFKKFKKNSLNFKKMYVVNELSKILPNVIYEPKEGLSETEVKKIDVIKNIDEIETEDLLRGKIKNTAFKASDVILFEVTKKNIKKSVFKGQYFIVDLKFEIESPVYVMSRSYSEYFSKKDDMLKSELEWIKFNKQFKVYSKVPKTAFKALTPRFMERLSNVNSEEIKSSFVFIEDKLYVIINSNIDTYDLRLFKPLNEKFLEEIKRQIEFVKEIITILE